MVGGMTEVGADVVVGESQEIEAGGVPSHSCISLMNSQSMSKLGNWNLMNSWRILISDTVYVFLDSVLVLEEKEQLCVVTLLTGPVLAVKVVFPGEPILAEGTLSV